MRAIVGDLDETAMTGVAARDSARAFQIAQRNVP